ncbi:POL1 protein, partial [Corythaeola cristata]|nr:POL1 protein [Corythaeola cristata]
FSMQAQILTTPQPGKVLFTDASSKMKTAVVIWQNKGEWLKNMFNDPAASVQKLEATAVAEALRMWPEEPLTIVTDSMFTYKLLQTMAMPGWAGSEIALQLEDALQSRKVPAAIVHVNSHTDIQGYYQEGNRLADQAAQGVWTLVHAKELHDMLHLGAKALARQCQIPISQAREVVSTCPYCQK